jgi:hypothetical protein
LLGFRRMKTWRSFPWTGLSGWTYLPGIRQHPLARHEKALRTHAHLGDHGTGGIPCRRYQVQYKLYVRNQDNETFVPPPRSGYHLKVMDPMGKTVYEIKELTLNEFGAGNGEFQVPKTGAVGWYRFELSASFAKWEREPMRVLVSDFTPSPFKVTTDLNGRFFETGNRVEISTHARLHGGGPYGDAHNRVTAVMKSRPLILKTPGLQNFQFDTTLPKAPAQETVYQTENRLNSQGDAECQFSLVEGKILYGRLVVESAVRDDRGKSIAGRAKAAYAARDRYVGIRRLAWVMEEDQPASFELLVVDGEGNPVKGVPIKVTLFATGDQSRPGQRRRQCLYHPLHPSMGGCGTKRGHIRFETRRLFPYPAKSGIPSHNGCHQRFQRPEAEQPHVSMGGGQRTGGVG